MKRLIIAFMCCVAAIAATAQIGYQVSLLNNATGESRANERVTVTVKITDSKGKVLCEETKNETTNDFGVISLSIGNDDTFTDADWSSLPFYIEATVDNRLIGKSQLLSVPVAEHAKHTGILTKEHLCSKSWTEYGRDHPYVYMFHANDNYYRDGKLRGTYVIDGNDIILYKYESDDNGNITYQSVESKLFKYDKTKDILHQTVGGSYYK